MYLFIISIYKKMDPWKCYFPPFFSQFFFISPSYIFFLLFLSFPLFSLFFPFSGGGGAFFFVRDKLVFFLRFFAPPPHETIILLFNAHTYSRVTRRSNWTSKVWRYFCWYRIQKNRDQKLALGSLSHDCMWYILILYCILCFSELITELNLIQNIVMHL